MAQTLAHRSGRLDDVPFVIVDEAHPRRWRRPGATIIAAVPHASGPRRHRHARAPRRQGAGCGAFDALVIGPSTSSELIADNWLSPFIAYAPERLVDLKGARAVAGDYALGDLERRMNVGFVLDDALAEYRKHLDGQTAIAFCVTINHSRMVARFFRTNGIRARHVDGDTPAKERRELIEQLATGEVQIITNCSLIAEGLDVPSVAGVILLRPTKSLALHLQQIGRALASRLPAKQRAVILDHAGNCLRHGMPDLEHPWSLEGRPKKRGKALVRRCPDCGALIPIAVHGCPECGADLRPEPIQPATVPDPLVELDPATAHERWLANGPFQAVMRWAGSNEARLRAVARARGYKPGWVWWRLKAERETADAAIINAAFGE